MEQQSCTIMGHNPQRFKFKYNEEAPLYRKIKEAIIEQIKILYIKGVKRFYVGCAVGVDTWAAEILLDLKKQTDFNEIELFCAVPFPEHFEKFTTGQKKRYQNIINQCTHKEIIYKNYSPVAYKRLNYYMIDKSQYLISVYDQDKSERSGLSQALNYAIKNNRQIIFIHPDTAESSEYKP